MPVYTLDPRSRRAPHLHAQQVCSVREGENLFRRLCVAAVAQQCPVPHLIAEGGSTMDFFLSVDPDKQARGC